MSTRVEELSRLARLYGEYLNGPIGKGVLSRMREGESFTIKTQGDVLKVIKLKGKAVVKVIASNAKLF